MKRLVFMTEEVSMEVCLKNILPKLLPDDVTFQIIPHEGKQDLEKSIPKKLRAWNDHEDVEYKFIILRDKDGGDCITLKDNLVKLCSNAGRSDTLVRIVCNELESWFLGDLKAVELGIEINNISTMQRKKKFRNPDELTNACEELKKLCGSYQKINGSKKISPYLDLENNSSTSFNIFISGVKKIAEL
ncbi:hypothetical protein SDC9_132362 [bioreactor metagenome]|uniref:DUF4276 domain-containing protein n=1 Tax=bioreactor metagenome TaxID=1076179 RepID=A0A645D7G4_9ZZZZ